MSESSWRVPVEKLYHPCDPSFFNFSTTEELDILDDIIGQERAARAMEFGLKVKKDGYNIFVAGQTGTGKRSYSRSIVEKVALQEEPPLDWLYVNNFEQPDEPLALSLPAGKGSIFVRDIDTLLKELKEDIPKAFNSEEYEKEKSNMYKKFQETRSQYMEELNKTAKEQGFVLKRTSSGFVSIPLLEGKEISDEEYSQLEPEVREELEKKSTAIQLKAMEIMRRINNEEKALRNYFKEMDYKKGLEILHQPLNELLEKYKNHPKVISYLKALKEDILNNLDTFKVEEEEDKQLPFYWLKRQGQETAENKYRVNLLVDNKETKGAPVVFEANPNYYNLLGRVEYEHRLGVMGTDFTMIKPGALHRANGGYLILQARDLLTNVQAWDVLKRALKTKEICMETLGEQYALLAISTLKPEPIPLNVKVILIGTPLIYRLLYQYDEDFRKLFKIKADFDIEMDRNEKNVYRMAQFISTHCKKEGLRHLDPSAVAKVVEYSSRLSEDQKKLCTCFNEIVEILYEADAWAGMEGDKIVSARHIKKAIDEKIYRSNKYEKKIQNLIDEGKILIDLDKEVVGQVNALSVIGLGDYSFGRPNRITAATYLGRKGIVNIERESKMSGQIHDKGVLIISGFLGEKYAQDKALNLSASICFEQSYSGVEGDSASSAELYAIISSLAEVPIKQWLAVTGSVNQKGQIQPVGGINEKIEGFFVACKLKGLTGKQGVIIPKKNVSNLMLKDEVLDAVAKGQFHIYAVSNVFEGLEILTGLPAGERQKDGTFPKGTINYFVSRKIKKYNDILKKEKEADKPLEVKNRSEE